MDPITDLIGFFDHAQYQTQGDILTQDDLDNLTDYHN